MDNAILISYITVSFIAGFSTGIVLFIIGGYIMVKKGGAAKLMTDASQ